MNTGRDVRLRGAPLRALLLLAAIGATGSASAQTLQPKMGDPISGLTASELDRFLEGKIRFEQVFTAPQGLGPIFNDDSCASCHSLPATGGAGVLEVTRFGFAEKGFPFDPMASQGGSLLQAIAISGACLETIPGGANVIADRLTPSIFGSGLVEAIPDAALLALEAGGGMAHLVQPLEDPTGPLRVGRFGWKAQVATILTFSGDASLNEMGITNALVGQENAPNGNAALLLTCDGVADPEDLDDPFGVSFIERITDFQRFLSAPPQTPRSGMTGEAVFTTTGCASCHHTTFTTGGAPEAALSGKTIHPYSDFLLHDMGGLGDGIVQGAASEQQIRTPALWGVRGRRPLLHDGRVTTLDLGTAIDEVVGWHGGEAAAAATAYAALAPGARAQLISFLDSLGRIEFDATGDGIVIEIDVPAFLDCFTGPGGSISPDDPCAISDIDQDGDVDLADFALFEQAYEGVEEDCDLDGVWDVEELVTGAEADCNGNHRPDSCDIALGSSIDLNGGGVPDECEASFVRGDCNQDGGQDIGDAVSLLDYLFAGAADPACADACDSNDDGILDIADPIYLFTYLFSGGAAPAAPFPGCGLDGTGADPTGCGSHSSCP